MIKKIVGIFFILGAIFCVIYTYHYWNQYAEGNKEYEEVVSLYTNTKENEKSELAQNDNDNFYVNWGKLLSQNPDCVGWIKMSPSVSYPIVQGNNNQEYLHRGFNHSYNINGSVFMHYQNASDWTDKNTVIYGHNMNNGSMFGNNDRYKNKNYARKHPNFYIYTPEGKYTYQIFDTITTFDATHPYKLTFHNEKDFELYLKKMNELKNYGLDTKVSTKDRVVTLSTCTSHGKKRFLIQGVLKSFTNHKGETFAVDMINTEEHLNPREYTRKNN